MWKRIESSKTAQIIAIRYYVGEARFVFNSGCKHWLGSYPYIVCYSDPETKLICLEVIKEYEFGSCKLSGVRNAEQWARYFTNRRLHNEVLEMGFPKQGRMLALTPEEMRRITGDNKKQMIFRVEK